MGEREKIVEVMARVLEPLAWEICDKASDYANLNPRQVHPHSLKKAKDILAALEAAGVRLAPVEATTDMQNAAAPLLAEVNSIIATHAVRTGTDGLKQPVSLAQIYAAMIAASPYAPAAPGGKDEQ